MRRVVTLLVCALLLVAGGCGKKTQPVAPVVPLPAPESPEAAVRLLESSWKGRDTLSYACLFTDDYRFQFAFGDSAGNPYRDAPFERVDELLTSTGLFVGTSDHAAASDIQLDFDKVLIPLPDDRPGKPAPWHYSIRTKVNLKVTLDRGGGPEVHEVNGYAKFYLVRGDSAAIPPDLVARGVVADEARWWIDRWEDETLPYTGARAHPTQNWSWGSIKFLFR